MNKISSLVAMIIFWMSTQSFAQTSAYTPSETSVRKDRDCACPESPFPGTSARAIYTLSGTHILAICGYSIMDTRKDTLVMSEFVISNCPEGLVLATWGSMDLCRLYQKSDTLHVEEVVDLPLGVDFGRRQVVWKTTRYFVRSDSVHAEQALNRKGMPIYTDEQAALVAQKYGKITQRLDEEMMHWLDRLFAATISGNADARVFFLAFGKQFPDISGAYATQYRILRTMLEEWDHSG